MELAKGVLIAGKYRLDRPLATGGMAAVWVARHAQLDTPVAVKFMDADHAASAVARARFEREAKAAAALRNLHVVHVLDYGVEHDTPYLVMELLEGEDLGKRLHRVRRISLAAASQILTQAAKGLRPAHEAGVVHRDLKPANLFLAKVDDDEELVKILDFGIAKDTLNAPLGEGTKTGELMGSPHYMSPEQVRGARDLDPRSDLWSLAVILFRALTGRLPFTGDQIGSVIGQILADPIPVATLVAPDLPRALDDFFARGFARDRAQRFQTARAMADALAAIAASAGASANLAAQGALLEDPPTRPRFSSMFSIDPSSLPPASSSRPSFPTGPISTSGLGSGSGGFSRTGGPAVPAEPPAAPPKPSMLRWLPVGGAAVGVAIGAVAFLAMGPAHEPSARPAATATAGDAPPATEPTVTASAVATAAVSATATAAASAPHLPSGKPATRPSSTPSLKAKKKPKWGF